MSASETALLAEYAEVNGNFRLLTDIRFKLLALLPLAAAVAFGLGVIREGGSDRGTMAVAFAIFAFGLLVTAALASYNERNDQLYLWLVTRGARIERELGLVNGSFAHRPNAWFDIDLGLGRWHVGHASSIHMMYAGAAVLWAGGAAVTATQFAWGDQPVPPAVYAGMVLAAAGGTLVAIRRLGDQRRNRRRAMREAGERALQLARRLASENGLERRENDTEFDEFVAACLELIGRDHRPTDRREEVLFRIDFYGRMDAEERQRHGLRELSTDEGLENYVSLIVDLPPYMFTKSPLRR